MSVHPVPSPRRIPSLELVHQFEQHIPKVRKLVPPRLDLSIRLSRLDDSPMLLRKPDLHLSHLIIAPTDVPKHLPRDEFRSEAALDRGEGESLEVGEFEEVREAVEGFRRRGEGEMEFFLLNAMSSARWRSLGVELGGKRRVEKVKLLLRLAKSRCEVRSQVRKAAYVV